MRAKFRPIPRKKQWNRWACLRIKRAWEAFGNGASLDELVRIYGISPKRAAEICAVRVVEAVH